jgi:hypothetical protein
VPSDERSPRVDTNRSVNGSEYDGQPERAIATARQELADAAQPAKVLYGALSAAQNTISRIHYAGPGLGRD